jgi:flavin reductase (DIM6/NTAB) family NADH-FMN oxidoreductase RutF
MGQAVGAAQNLIDLAVQSSAYRRALGCMPTGVTVVTGRDSQGQPRGFTANSFTSVSLDPPIVLFCVAKSAVSHAALIRTPRFAVNILGQDQHGLSGLFASKQVNKFRGAEWYPAAKGTPILNGVVAWFDCRRIRTDEIGDHDVVYGEVEEFEASEQAPLSYLRGAYARSSI